MELDHTSRWIPPEICTQILSYLPVKSLLRLRSVSQEWKSIIDNPDFTSLHLSRYSNNRLETHLMVLERHRQRGVIEPRARWFSRCPLTQYYQQTSEIDDFPVPIEHPDPGHPGVGLVIIGDIDGLLLVENRRGKLGQCDIVLLNLSIRKSLCIRPPSSSVPQCQDLFLGFDPSTNDYKVVRMILHDEQSTITLDIFSLNTRSWRKGSCSDTGAEVCRLFSSEDNKVPLGGSVHWVGNDLYLQGFEYEKGLGSFNMNYEIFSYTPLPKLSYEPDVETIEVAVGVAGSWVGLLTSCHGITDIWVLDRDGCWSKRFTIEAEIGYMADPCLYLSKDGMLIWESDSIDETVICASDINTGKKSIVSRSRQWQSFYVGSYTESLVLLR